MAKTQKITGQELVKHRNEINSARTRYTVLDEKLFVLLYSKLTGEEKELPPIVLDTTEVCKALGTRVEDMRRAMKRLTLVPLEIGNIDDLEAPYRLIMPIIGFAHTPNVKQVEITLNPGLKEYFLDIRKQFTMFVADHCYRLSSRYSIRIYKMVMQWWSKIDAEGSWDIELNWENMRQIFQFKPEQYSDPSKFKRDVLRKAIADINQANVGIQLEHTATYKVGRNVVDFVLTATKVQSSDVVQKRVKVPTKRELSDEDFKAMHQAEFDKIMEGIMATDAVSLDLPLGVAKPSPEILNAMCERQAMSELKRRHKKK